MQFAGQPSLIAPLGRGQSLQSPAKSGPCSPSPSPLAAAFPPVMDPVSSHIPSCDGPH